MNKLYVFFFIAALFAVASAIGGVKDAAGNYYDFTTGQVASSATGKVYSPHYAYSPYLAHPYAANLYGAYVV